MDNKKEIQDLLTDKVETAMFGELLFPRDGSFQRTSNFPLSKVKTPELFYEHIVGGRPRELQLFFPWIDRFICEVKLSIYGPFDEVIMSDVDTVHRIRVHLNDAEDPGMRDWLYKGALTELLKSQCQVRLKLIQTAKFALVRGVTEKPDN